MEDDNDSGSSSLDKSQSPQLSGPEGAQTYGSDVADVVYIGPLTGEQRLEKVRKYLHKKYAKKQASKQHVYTCRKNVASKRLRIKGRFVTME